MSSENINIFIIFLVFLSPQDMLSTFSIIFAEQKNKVDINCKII